MIVRFYSVSVLVLKYFEYTLHVMSRFAQYIEVVATRVTVFLGYHFHWAKSGGWAVNP